MTRRDIHHNQHGDHLGDSLDDQVDRPVGGGHPESPPSRRPVFLTLPERTAKPRRTGVTHLLDNGISLAETEQRLAAASDSIDIWKLGWGTAYLDPSLDAKLALLSKHGVLACPGGTLLEIAWRQGVAGEFFDWAEAVGFPAIEVSCGSVSMTRDVKDTLIGAAATRFTVLAEVGRKDPTAPVSAKEWARDAAADVAAGAHWVVTEGRESGTVGLFTAQGDVRPGIVDAVVASVGLDTLLFEAPQRAQQAWLIRHLGPDVNLGNINLGDALSVEALRLGLRSDTLDALFTTGSSAAREARS